jgi:hypothetical protein
MQYTTSGFLNNIVGNAYDALPEEEAPALEPAIKGELCEPYTLKSIAKIVPLLKS